LFVFIVLARFGVAESLCLSLLRNIHSRGRHDTRRFLGAWGDLNCI